MSTTNIQETWVETSIFFLEQDTAEDFTGDEAFEGMSEDEINESLNEQFWDYVNSDLLSNIWSELNLSSIDLYNHCDEVRETIDLEIEVRSGYHDWAYIIIKPSYDFEDWELSNSSIRKIDREIRKIEKVLRKFTIEIKCVWVFSNWEGVYRKV